jgi:NAD(P)-dependent dehydrogenase (short-subunit alcohol dehydrogenase family)
VRLALVTGGTRRLGAAIAARLAAEGYTLALHAHDHPEPEGVEGQVFTADLENAEEARGLIPRVTQAFGTPPSLLVNSAALFADDSFGRIDPELAVRHYRINTLAPALLIDAMAAAGGEGDRSVVNILDQRIAHPHGDQLGYTLSKCALAGLTQAAARALAPGLRVNAVAPGLTLPTDDYAPGQMERLAKLMPLDRLPRPEDVAAAVSYLASATATTGQTIYADGGAGGVAFLRDFAALAVHPEGSGAA